MNSFIKTHNHNPIIRQAPVDIPPLVRMENISKRFGRVSVLKNVRFELRGGEVHALAGENGAGKSTLIKILAGVYTDFEGRIEISGRAVRPKTTHEANALGISVIHQELSLIGSMSVADNIFLGQLKTRAGFVDQARQREGAAECLDRLGLDIDVREPLESFPIAIQQLVEIAKALTQNAKTIIMDEPTSALNEPEVEHLFALIQSLKKRGCGVIYITHKMEEIERIADRITVFRDGRWIGTAPASELPTPKLIEWMAGCEMKERAPHRALHFGSERLQLKNFSVFPKGFSNNAAIRNVSLTVRAGEILGVAGLHGSGRANFFMDCSAVMVLTFAGKHSWTGKRFASPRRARRLKPALVFSPVTAKPRG